MRELAPKEYKRALPLFQGFDYSLSIHAAMEGNNPGRIFVDDVHHPHTSLALTVEGYLLAGDDSNPETNDNLRHLFKERIFTGEVFVNGDWSMSLAIHPETWEAKLPEIIPTHEIEKIDRYHYLCREINLDWTNLVPENYSVHHLDRALLEDTRIVIPEVVREWMDIKEVWWTVENFLTKGASFVVLQGNEVVAWCTPDCVAGDRIDVGVITHPAHRRRGLASLAVAATADYCLNHGYKAIGWHCNSDNVGSWKTAEKVGFKRNCQYTYYYYMVDPIDHLAELGWYYYRRGEYARTMHYYEKVFTAREENPDYYYHLAASAMALLGQKEGTLKYLKMAVDHGWTDGKWTKQQEEFSILHDLPEWDAILARMECAEN